ncbi:LysR family transcriptional regulator [Zoogloea sp. LCSB751]|uniref:LysR family transcriptional regulator n=1 Tax=Zoogloea sp. LCSB751 TaxID=1965277 RepID=UPI0009A478FE|nr:LysR family transcriptional regulator [Zoogloea sp. LCSB751]
MLATETLQAFVAVIDEGSFSAAAERLQLTPSGISRSIGKLEKQLGVRLITRTTRRLDLTDEGRWFLDNARDILGRLEATALTLQSAAEHPSGLLRVNAATPVFNHVLAPLLPEFCRRYPRIQLELTSGETIVDLIEQRADVALRVGQLQDSTLNARLLLESRLRLVAAPDYLARRGRPQNADDLATHALLGFTQPSSLNLWPLQHAGADGYPIEPTIAASNGETLAFLARTGNGIACLSDFLVRDDLSAGSLIEVLPDAVLPWKQPVWAVFYRQGFLAARVAHFVDYLATQLRGETR